MKNIPLLAKAEKLASSLELELVTWALNGVWIALLPKHMTNQRDELFDWEAEEDTNDTVNSVLEEGALKVRSHGRAYLRQYMYGEWKKIRFNRFAYMPDIRTA